MLRAAPSRSLAPPRAAAPATCCGPGSPWFLWAARLAWKRRVSYVATYCPVSSAKARRASGLAERETAQTLLQRSAASSVWKGEGP